MGCMYCCEDANVIVRCVAECEIEYVIDEDGNIDYIEDTNVIETKSVKHAFCAACGEKIEKTIKGL